VTRANGVTTTYSYQPLRLWLTGMKTTNAAGAVLQNLAYTRDTRGRITAADSNISYESWTYGYDNFDRLTSATNAVDSTLTQSFTYNAVGNITWNSLRGTYTYRAPGQPHPHAVIQAATTIFTYDANGNTTSGGGTSVTYDGENRLVQDATSSFIYAPDGSRLKKTVNGTTTLYVGDDWEVTGGVSTYYLPGDAVMTGAVVSWLHRDVLGSVRLTTNAAGATVQRAQYRPYGERLEAIATLMTSKGFIGERNDETGLIYLHARYLNPYLGRFITPDPSPDPTQPGVGLDRYAYAGDSPIVNLDTSGLAVGSPNDPANRNTGGIAGNSIGANASIGDGTGTNNAGLGDGPQVAQLFEPVAAPASLLPPAYQTPWDQQLQKDITWTSNKLGAWLDLRGGWFDFGGWINGVFNSKDDAQTPEKGATGASGQTPPTEAQGNTDQQATDAVKEKRKASATIRREWERATGRPWPKDPKDPTKNQDVSHKKALAGC
jgi:RHS repeat-associated protein